MQTFRIVLVAVVMWSVVTPAQERVGAPAVIGLHRWHVERLRDRFKRIVHTETQEEQINRSGLTLESDRGPVEFLIIDRVERPQPD